MDWRFVQYGFWKNKRIVLYDTLLSPEMNDKLKEINGETAVDSATANESKAMIKPSSIQGTTTPSFSRTVNVVRG
jgi:hypothetical protein